MVNLINLLITSLQPITGVSALAFPQQMELGETNQTHPERMDEEQQMQRETGEAHKLVVIREDETVVVENPDDGDLAEEMQMQELLFFQLQLNKLLETTQASNTPIEDPIDLKGKQVMNYTFEQGESSRVIHDTFYCAICMEEIPEKDGFNINPCDHIFCTGCMIHYITTKTEENEVSIPCPALGCESPPLDPVSCQHILPKDTFNRWSLVLCELSLGLNKLYCPFKDCSAPLINEEEEGKITISECPHCNRMFCARCKVPWHNDMICEEFAKLDEDERGREDIMLKNLAKDKRWQRCPECRMYVEKIDGCMFMKCRCGYCFCYACAAPMSSATHYCAKCKR